MAQSDGTNQLKRMEFEFKGKSLKLSINPEEMTQDETSRSTVTQTKSSAWVDDFGGGLPSIFIKGSTGFKKGGGYEKFKEFRDLIREYYDDTGTDEITFHNYTDGESWIVHTDPQGFRLLRSKSNPLLYMYEIRLICLRPASKPKESKSKGGVKEDLGTPPKVTKDDKKKKKKKKTDTKKTDKGGTSAKKSSKSAPFISKSLSGLVAGLPNSFLTSFIRVLKPTTKGGIVLFNTNGSSGAKTFSVIGTINNSHVSQVETKLEPSISRIAVSQLKRIQLGEVESHRSPVEEDSLLAYIDIFQNSSFPAEITTAFKMVLLEVYAIFTESELDPDGFSDKVSVGEIERVINNVRWLSDAVVNLNEPLYDLANELRWMERALRYYINSDLISDGFYDKLNKVNDSRLE